VTPLFQSEINKSLAACSERVLDLYEDMREQTDSAERIREDIKGLQSRWVAVLLLLLLLTAWCAGGRGCTTLAGGGGSLV
jgi:hypothetical protein